MKKRIYQLWILLLIVCPFTVFAEEKIEESKVVVLEKCIDGDTATFKDSAGATYKTRFLAIDTPETVHPTKGEQPYGKKASDYTCEVLTSATEIKLEMDPNSDKEDKYGRLLAWVFVDGTLLQDSLVSQGLAKIAYVYDDYKYIEELKEKEEQAKNSKLGVWSETEETQEESNIEKNTTTENKLSDDDKNFIEKLIDDLLAKIFDYVDSLLDRIASWIEDML